MIFIKITSFNEFLASVFPQTTESTYNNIQLVLEYIIQSNKEDFLGEYLQYLLENNVYVFLLTQEGNSSFYLQNFTDYNLITVELTVSDSTAPTYEFKKFGQIPLNENKILYTINNVLQELKENPGFILFDSISDIILWLDFNTTYKLIRKCMSTLRKRKNTSSLFLINKTSHSPEIISSFETLFDAVLISDGINEVRLLSTFKYRQATQ